MGWKELAWRNWMEIAGKDQGSGGNGIPWDGTARVGHGTNLKRWMGARETAPMKRVRRTWVHEEMAKHGNGVKRRTGWLNEWQKTRMNELMCGMSVVTGTSGMGSISGISGTSGCMRSMGVCIKKARRTMCEWVTERVNQWMRTWTKTPVHTCMTKWIHDTMDERIKDKIDGQIDNSPNAEMK